MLYWPRSDRTKKLPGIKETYRNVAGEKKLKGNTYVRVVRLTFSSFGDRFIEFDELQTFRQSLFEAN